MKENEVSNKGFPPFFPIVCGKFVITRSMGRKYFSACAIIGAVAGIVVYLCDFLLTLKINLT